MCTKNNEGKTALKVAEGEAELDSLPLSTSDAQIHSIIQLLKDVESLNNLLKASDALELSKDFIRERMFSPDVRFISHIKPNSCRCCVH